MEKTITSKDLSKIKTLTKLTETKKYLSYKK